MAFCEGMSETAFLNDAKTQLACSRCCEIIGEAANRVTSETREALPSIPWPLVIGFRNVLIHQYHRVDYRVVFRVIRKDMPGVLKELEAVLGKHGG
jgi:uncharacterized protein with HEPN domain